MEKVRIKSSKISKVEMLRWYYSDYISNSKPFKKEISYYDRNGNKIRFEEYLHFDDYPSIDFKHILTTTYEFNKKGRLTKKNETNWMGDTEKTVVEYLYNGNLSMEERMSHPESGLINSRTYYQYDNFGRISEKSEFGLNVVRDDPDTLSTTEHHGTTTVLRFKIANDDTTLILVKKEQYSYDDSAKTQIVSRMIPKASNDTISLFQPTVYGYYEGNEKIYSRYNPQGLIIQLKFNADLRRFDYLYNEKGNPVRKIESMLLEKDLIPKIIEELRYEYFK
ncbi:MAG: hypothetical protein ACHQQQ_12450 [Bacteroidota bacterium]